MIVLAGESRKQDEIVAALKRLGYVQETVAVEIHARACGLPTQSTLMHKLTETPGLMINNLEDLINKSRTSHGEWVARLEGMDEQTLGKWFIHDYRVFWFWDHFTQYVDEVKVIGLLSDETEYYQIVRPFLEDNLPSDALIIEGDFTLNELKVFVEGKGKKKKIPHLSNEPDAKADNKSSKGKE